LGFQPSSKDKSGNSALQRLALELPHQSQYERKRTEKFIHHLSREDAFDLMVILILQMKSQSQDEVSELLNFIVQEQIRSSQNDNIFMKSLKSTRMRKEETKIYLTTPLHFSVEVGNDELFDALVKLYPFHDIRNQIGKTILHLACEEGNEKCTEFLLQKEFDKNAKDQFGMTPLHLASLKGRTSCIRKLLDNQADMDVKDKKGLRVDSSTDLSIKVLW